MLLSIRMNSFSKKQLLDECEKLGIVKCYSKTKKQLIELIGDKSKPIDKPISKDVAFKFIDLFCGIGGFHQALKRLNGHCVFASDIDEQCRNTYEMNYGIKPSGDITKINPTDIPDFDVLTGGFPCQSFSNSGKKKGLSDERGKLFESILAIAQVKHPSYMFLENVKHIKKIDNGTVFDHILNRINESGYHVDTCELSPHQLGIPQQRERVIFICIRNDIYSPSIPVVIGVPNTKIDIDSIIEKDKTKLMPYHIPPELENVLEIWDEMVRHFDVGQSMSPVIMCNEFNSEYTEKEFKSLPKWKQEYITKNKPIYNKYKDKWDEWCDINKDQLTRREIYGKLEWQAGPKLPDDSIFNHFIQFRQSGIRVKKSKYFPTLVAIVQTPIYAKERRYITPRECARLQSFPESFILHEKDNVAYKQFGNAVNVDVVHYVMNIVLNLYNFKFN
uniref:DNA (cytosine-5-)-methyltransferase n=1 Tax=viral metagenome TaxID=1070528 RepID=A0A6C0BSF4_9ZZZZ